MFINGWFRFALLLVAVGLFAAATTPAIGSEPRAHGERLVAQYQLPTTAIERYVAIAEGTAGHELPRESTQFADRYPWVGARQRAGVGHNPYTLVFTISGTAKAAGDVVAQWQAGWHIQESSVASRQLVIPLPRETRTGVSAGQPLTLTTSSTRVSFRGERNVAPMLGLVQMRNMDISGVNLQVWSGEAAQAWSLPALPRGVLVAVGLACLLLAVRFGFGRTAAPAQATQPRSSRLPVTDIVSRPVTVAGAVAVDVAAPIAPLALPARAAPAELPAAAPSQQARVFAALQHVLTVGLAVPTVLDHKRIQRRRLTH